MNANTGGSERQRLSFKGAGKEAGSPPRTGPSSAVGQLFFPLEQGGARENQLQRSPRVSCWVVGWARVKTLRMGPASS